MRLDTRLSVRWRVAIAIAALSLAGGALATVAIEDLARHIMPPLYFDTEAGDWPGADEARRQAVGVLRPTALTTTVLLGIGLAFGTGWTRFVGLRTVLGCTVLGWLNCGAAVSLHGVISRGPAAGLEAAVTGLLFGICFGAPLGLLYGAASTFATKRLRRLLDRPTHASTWDASFAVGVTVLGSAGSAMIVAAARTDPIVPWHLPGGLALAGALLTSIALIRAHGIRRLRDDPARAGLERVHLEDLGVDASSLLPLHDGVAPAASHALVRVMPNRGDGAYRHATTRVPVALVD